MILPSEPEQQTTQADSPPETTEEAPPKDVMGRTKSQFFLQLNLTTRSLLMKYWINLCRLFSPNLPNLVLIANQNSGYWSLATTKKSNSNFLTWFSLNLSSQKIKKMI